MVKLRFNKRQFQHFRLCAEKDSLRLRSASLVLCHPGRRLLSASWIHGSKHANSLLNVESKIGASLVESSVICFPCYRNCNFCQPSRWVKDMNEYVCTVVLMIPQKASFFVSKRLSCLPLHWFIRPCYIWHPIQLKWPETRSHHQSMQLHHSPQGPGHSSEWDLDAHTNPWSSLSIASELWIHSFFKKGIQSLEK